MKKIIKKIFVIVFAAVLALMYSSVIVNADFGGHNTYSSSKSNSYSSSRSSRYSSSGGMSIEFFLIGIVIVGIVIALEYIYKHSKNIYPNRNKEIEEILKKKYYNFSSDEFIEAVKKIFIEMQISWSKRDISSLRDVIHIDLYNQTTKQISEMIRNEIINYIEDIDIKTAYLTLYKEETDYEYIAVYLEADMIDYQIKETTGEIIKGDKTTKWDLKYKMEFICSKENPSWLLYKHGLAENN